MTTQHRDAALSPSEQATIRQLLDADRQRTETRIAVLGHDRDEMVQSAAQSAPDTVGQEGHKHAYRDRKLAGSSPRRSVLALAPGIILLVPPIVSLARFVGRVRRAQRVLVDGVEGRLHRDVVSPAVATIDDGAGSALVGVHVTVHVIDSPACSSVGWKRSI